MTQDIHKLVNKTAVDKKWYAVQTKIKSEQLVCQRIEIDKEKGVIEVEVYLPLIKENNNFKPLFNGYIFVKHTQDEIHKIRYLPGVKDYVRFGLYPTSIPENQISLMEKIESSFNDVTTVDSYLVKGCKVQIIKGVLAGRKGVLTETTKNKKIAIAIDNFGKSVLISMPVTDVVEIETI
ncbi:transcription termination/antitermination NusG family protein [Pseudoalteromonas sp. NBT06-2]|uniref:transcription termination/antitermination protein NusG n=1 Tax=Pseudoalteromonas sp. NBT06-2 TaxID=2025950 RepID=UPI0014830C7D|nr:transcription termination/antitermination NusG family protein [Pseudoalteromonas sp. NBT06-2]